MPLVITDSTALIGLDRIGHLDLLPALFEEIAAPPAVAQEFGRQEEWLDVRQAQDRETARVVRAQLHEGEAEAIVLSLENPGSILLIDERRGRRYATRLGLSVIGTFGVLLLAKQRGLISAVRPLIDALRSAGFHSTTSLRQEILRLAGESEQ